MSPSNLTQVQGYLSGIALADHMGDVNDYLPSLCKALGLEEPTWHGRRYVMAWEDRGDDVDD